MHKKESLYLELHRIINSILNINFNDFFNAHISLGKLKLNNPTDISDSDQINATEKYKKEMKLNLDFILSIILKSLRIKYYITMHKKELEKDIANNIFEVLNLIIDFEYNKRKYFNQCEALWQAEISGFSCNLDSVERCDVNSLMYNIDERMNDFKL